MGTPVAGLVRAVLSVLAMHKVFFGLKRAHHSVLRITRTALARMGLTAARFDLLYAVRERRNGVDQRNLQRRLGVGRSTVSRMLASLEKLGLVRRSVAGHDRRRKVVQLTTRGRWRIGFAHRNLTLSGWAQLALDSALGTDRDSDQWCNEGACIMATATIDGLLNRIRRAFGDGATLHYFGDPDDFDDPWEDVLDFDGQHGSSYSSAASAS
jgi:DNA-binding MarR family transcriptional regulator